MVIVIIIIKVLTSTLYSSAKQFNQNTTSQAAKTLTAYNTSPNTLLTIWMDRLQRS